MAKLLCCKENKNLYETIERYTDGVLPREILLEIKEPLRSAKAPKKDGRGNPEQKPVDFDAFLKLLDTQNIQFKTGKHIALKMAGQKRFSRLKSLSENDSEEAIRERIDGKRIVPKREVKQAKQPPKFNLLIDIQNNIKAQNSPGYERWAKLFNLKQAAKTLLFLQDNDITEISKLQEKAHWLLQQNTRSLCGICNCKCRQEKALCGV